MAAESWMLSDVIEVLGWTLLHIVWQGIAAVVLLSALLLILRRASAQARYVTACATLGLIALCPIVTGVWLAVTKTSPVSEPIAAINVKEEITDQTPLGWTVVDDEGGGAYPGILLVEPPPPPTVEKPRVIKASTPAVAVRDVPRWGEHLQTQLTLSLPWLVSGWLAGVVVLSLRLLVGWWSVQRLRRRAHQPADENWQALLRRLAERLRVTRPVKLVESALVEVPTVIGWLSPLILLPASAMTGLTTEQLEALLAHELAHVRRHDYLINLLQTVVETLLFYHPAVWWISHRIRLEREHCCDDLAVQVCGDGLTYAKALVALEELRAPKLGLAMSSSGGSLLARVARLLGQAEQQRRPTGWVAGLLSLVLLTMAGALGAGLLTPPGKPTKGLPNDTPPNAAKSTDTDEETFGPTQRRGQETRAEREVALAEREDENDQELRKTLAIRVRDAAAALANGRLELGLEQECFLKSSADKPDGEVAKSTATSRWIGEGQKWRVDYDGRMLRSIENRIVNEWLPLQWTAGFDGQQHYHWDRAGKQIELGREFAMALQHSPARLFFGFTVDDFQMLLAAPKTKTSAITHQGLKCIQVDAELVVQSKTQRFVFILCPERGYVALENRFYSDGQFVGETKFSDFYEPKAGVWAARKIQVQSADPDNPNMEKPLERIIHTVKRLDLGETAKLQAEEFRADPPEGTKRIDSTKPGDLRSENDINIRFAEKSAEVAKAEWEKMMEANRKVPGSIPATEIERAIRDYNNAVLKIEKAQREQRILQLELELALGQDKEDGLELTHKTLELRWLQAKVAADLAKAEHDRINDANRRVPGTIPEAEVAKARRTDEAARSQLERAQIEFQIDAELTKLTEVAFTDNPLADVATFLSDYHNIPVELDATAKKFEVSPVTLTVTGADLVEVLLLALHPMKLSYCIDSGRLLIATPEEVQRRGHKLPRSFADELAVLLKAESTIAWESLLRGSFGENDFVVVVPKLSKLLDSDDVTVQRYAARGLVQFDFVPAQARPRLEKLARSKDTRVARGAWLALVSIGHKDFSTLPLMLAELDRADKPFGQLWPVLLAHFDESVWEELTKAFPTSSPQVRATLAASVRNQTDRSLPVALLALEDAEHRVRRTALNSIRYQEPPTKLVSALQARLKDEALDIRVQAAGRLLSYGKAVNEAVELLLPELEQADQGRAYVALRNFLQVHSPEAIRAVVDALDAPTRSKDASRSRAAWRALMFVNLVTGSNHPTEVPWGPTRAGLRTRLSVVDSTSDRPPYAASVGEPIKLKLELKNISEQPVEYDAPQAGVNDSLRVFDDEMRPVKYVGQQVSPTGSKQTIKPGETQVLVEQLDLTALYDLKEPGKYYIQWTQGSRSIAPDDAKTPFVPNSNVLSLEIQKADGNGDKPAAKEGDLRSDAAAGSGDPRRAQENDVEISSAQKSAAVAKAEWVRLLEVNRKVAGTIAESEIQRAKANYEKTLRQLELSDQEKAAAQAEIEALEKVANEVRVRFADKSAAVAKAEYDKMLESNRRVPGSIPETEVQRAKLNWELAQLRLEQAGANQARRDDPDLRVRLAKKAAEVAKAEYEKMLESNRRVPGAIPNTEIERARLNYERALLVEEQAGHLKAIHELKTRLAIERGVAFLKSRQTENGQWPELPYAGLFDGGVSSLCVLALLQSGAKPDEPIIQKALASLRKIEPTKTYTVALQTMVFCAAVPKEDGELIRRRVAWIEKAQVAVGQSRGGWHYQSNAVGASDGSNSRFAVMGLHAAKKAGFDVREETWRRVSDYWLSTSKAQNGWGYTPGSKPTMSMTLAGIASLAAAHRYLPRDEQAQAREAAIRQSAEFVEGGIPDSPIGAWLYMAQCLERAGHVSGMTHFGKLDWKADMSKRLLDRQQADGSWKSPGPGENDSLIATSLALLALTGEPEPKLVGHRMRFEPREAGKTFQYHGHLNENSLPPQHHTELSGGVRIEFVEPDGVKWRIEADRVVIESDALFDLKFEINPSNRISRFECIGSVKVEGGKGDKLSRITADRLELDLSQNDSIVSKFISDSGRGEKKPLGVGTPTALGAGLPTPPEKPTEGLPKSRSDSQPDENSNKGDLRSSEAAGSGDPRRAQERKKPLPNGEIYDAVNPLSKREQSVPLYGELRFSKSDADAGRDPKMFGQFIGRVRLKTEKPLPDLEKVVVPAGKVLDESLVFSKDGGLANVFVYLQKPTFPIEPPPSNRPPKPFILIAEGGKFWPHAAFVRVGRPIVFENRQTDLVNFFMDPQRNVSFNVVAKVQDQVKLQALRNSEKFPFAVKSTIQPWMQAHLLTLDHPFAAVTDEEGRFTINGLPPGEHEFRVWHERVGYLEKKLAVTIKSGEESRGDLQYEPARLKLVEAEVQNWSNRHIDTQRGPQPRVPRRAAPQPVVKPKDAEAEAANRRVRSELAHG